MKADTEPASSGGPSLSGKTKGKRSKLSQRRKDDEPETGLMSMTVGNGDVVGGNGSNPGAHLHQHHQQQHHHQHQHHHQQQHHQSHLQSHLQSGFFGGSDPLGLDVGDGMQPHAGGGSPTLLSALKGSSLRAAYGQDFAGSFKEDTMSLLSDFKNAAARFSSNPLSGGTDGLSAEGDLQSDALWSSFPSDVDALFPSRVDMQLAAEMYGAGDARGDGNGSARGGGGGSGPDAGNRDGDGSPESAAEAFRRDAGNAPSRFAFDGYGNGNAPNGGVHGNAHASLSLDASYDAYSGGQFKQQQRGGGGGGGDIAARGDGIHSPGLMSGSYRVRDDSRYDRVQYYVGNGGNPLGHHSNASYENGFGNAETRGEISRGGLLVHGPQGNGYPGHGYPGHGNAYPRAMMRVPSSGSLGMMPPGSSGGYVSSLVGDRDHERRGFGFDGNAAAKGSKRGAGGKSEGGKSAGSKRSETGEGTSKGASDGVGAGATHGGADGAAGNGHWSYGGPPPEMQRRLQQHAAGVMYHQRQTQHAGRMMTQHQHAGSMYSGTSSMSTTISGNSAGFAVRGGDGDVDGNARGAMMVPPYHVNQRGAGVNDGQMYARGNCAARDASSEETGLAELEAIIGKLDEATSHNIKESLYRLARSARVRGARSAGGVGGSQHAGVSSRAQDPGDEAHSMVDRCVANLLYHRYPDAPAETNDAFRDAGQSQQMDVAGDGGTRPNVAGVHSGMNGIRGRHGSA